VNSRIIAVSGPSRGAEFPLQAQRISVGRDRSNTICLEHLSVSRNHCVLRSNEERWILTDLDSRNGTFVNGVPVRERVLEHGDQLQIGDCVFLFIAQGKHTSGDTPSTLPQEDRPNSTVVLLPSESRYVHPEMLTAALLADPYAHAAGIARDLNTLLAFSMSIQSCSGVSTICHHLLKAAWELTQAPQAAVWLSNGGDGAASFGWQAHSGPVAASAALLKVVATVAEQKATLVSQLPSLPGRSTVTAPILCMERIVGVLAVECNSGHAAAVSENHLQMLSAIASIAGPVLDHALQMQILESENARLRSGLAMEHGMVGESAKMLAVFQLIARVSPTDSTVLVRGESGTGKELVARAIHAGSPRAGKPFVAVNCATLSESLLESELFGHERGAFTGAIAQKKGKLELAEHGTLFLDEVCEMAPLLQAKLLRVLQEREFERVGGTRPIRADIRLIAATNRNMEEAVESGALRRDLYYRLNVIPIWLPPLRERPEDITLLASYFISRYAAKTGRKVTGLSPEARAYLQHYAWPGNVRELENAMERAVVLGSAEMVTPEDLPEALLEGPAPPGVPLSGYHEALAQMKKQLILSSIEKAGGSHVEAAKLLGLHPNYLSRLIRNLDLKEALRAAKA
jgi:Nif-specific regulatory protein